MDKWIWQSKNYPNFSYNEELLQSLLNEIYANNEELNLIILKNQPNIDSLEAQIDSLSNEIINSADIEGEILQRESVRSSLRKKLDREFNSLRDTYATRQSDNYVNLLLDTNLNKSPLSIERLHGWHNCLFESGYSGLYKINVAKFRTEEMQVVSGKIGKEKIHYEAVLTKDISKNMQSFLKFCNDSQVNPYIKSAIAHLWFVIIHPYDDGNGRIARAIADFLLPNENIKLYSLSQAINTHKKEYYEILEKTNKFNEDCDITKWIEWHLHITNHALKKSLLEIDKILTKTQFWDTYRTFNFNKNQQKFLNKILDIGINNFKGNINLSKYASITKTNFNIAQKEFEELLDFKCLVKKENSDSFAFNDEFIQNKSSLKKTENFKAKIQFRQNNLDDIMNKIDQAKAHRQKADEAYKNGMQNIHTTYQNQAHLKNESLPQEQNITEQENLKQTMKKRK